MRTDHPDLLKKVSDDDIRSWVEIVDPLDLLRCAAGLRVILAVCDRDDCGFVIPRFRVRLDGASTIPLRSAASDIRST
jgi:hypothetical protein